MSSKRLEILEDLQSRLKNITVANNYLTNIGKNVVYWQDTDFEYGESVLAFKDTVEEVLQVNYPYEKVLCVEIAVYWQIVDDNLLTVSSQILKDLENCLDKFLVLRGNANMVNNEKIVETKGKKTLQIKVKLKIQYRDFLE